MENETKNDRKTEINDRFKKNENVNIPTLSFLVSRDTL